MKKSFFTIVVLFALVIYPSQVFAADTSQTQLMTYLPYILIGGAAILLVSIVGILLSKKKEKKEENQVPSTTPSVEQVTPIENTTTIPEPVQPVNMDEISNNLYSPAVAKPAIQETMESNTIPEEQPITQPEFTQSVTPVAEEVKSSDLQDILQGEASASPMGPVTDHGMEETPVLETPTEPTVSEVTTTPDLTMGTSFNSSAPEVTPAVPDLQQFINNQVAEVPPMAPSTMENPTPAVTPVQDFNPAPADTATPNQTETPPFSV